MPYQVKKCLSFNAGEGVGEKFGKENGVKEKRKQPPSPYVFISPEVRTTLCNDDLLPDFAIFIFNPKNVLDDVIEHSIHLCHNLDFCYIDGHCKTAYHRG